MRFIICELALTMALISGPVAGDESEIWNQLKAGGHVILIRHGEVDNLSKSSSPDADFDGCDGQRNLTDNGRHQAEQLGNSLRARKIPIGDVLVSPLCRTRDTARIAFDAFQVWPLLEPLPESDLNDRQRRIQAIRQTISEYKGQGNFVLVTHQPNIEALTSEVADFVAIVVVKPDGAGNFKVLQKLPFKAWRMNR